MRIIRMDSVGEATFPGLPDSLPSSSATLPSRCFTSSLRSSTTFSVKGAITEMNGEGRRKEGQRKERGSAGRGLRN